MNSKNLISILYVKQWYKNLVIFIPLLFTYNLFKFNLALLTLAGFISLCLMSSGNYLLNDLVDFKKDKLNPLKKHKPLVKGLLNKQSAKILMIVVIAASLLIAYCLGFNFLVFPIALFFSTLAYSSFLKRVPLIDLFVIALNFFLRTTSGAFLINVVVSSWLILMIFLIALFLGLGKRYGELVLLGERAVKSRRVYEFYSKDFVKSMINIITSMLLLSYCFYTFLAQSKPLVMFTIPIFFFIVFRYLYLILSGSQVSVETYQVFKDKQFLAGLACWMITVVLVLY